MLEMVPIPASFRYLMGTFPSESLRESVDLLAYLSPFIPSFSLSSLPILNVPFLVKRTKETSKLTLSFILSLYAGESGEEAFSSWLYLYACELE